MLKLSVRSCAGTVDGPSCTHSKADKSVGKLGQSFFFCWPLPPPSRKAKVRYLDVRVSSIQDFKVSVPKMLAKSRVQNGLLEPFLQLDLLCLILLAIASKVPQKDPSRFDLRS